MFKLIKRVTRPNLAPWWFLGTIVVGFLGLTTWSNFFQAGLSTPFDHLEAARDSSVKIGINGPGHGSGVVLTDTGLILTNAHVCKQGKNGMKVWTRDDVKVDAKVLWMTEVTNGSDFCVLQASSKPFIEHPGYRDVPTIQWSPVTFSTDYTLGQSVFHIGNMMGVRELISWGRLGQGDSWGSNPGYRYDGTSGPGSSGGGVFNEEGELLGLLTWGYHLAILSRMRMVRVPLGVGGMQPISLYLEITGQ